MAKIRTTNFVFMSSAQLCRCEQDWSSLCPGGAGTDGIGQQLAAP